MVVWSYVFGNPAYYSLLLETHHVLPWIKSSKQLCPIEMAYEPQVQLKFSSSHVTKGKKEQMKSILIMYFIEPHLPKIVPFQPVTNILKEFKLSQSLIDDMYFNT